MKSLAVPTLAFAICLVLALFGSSASASPLPCQGCIFGGAKTEVISAAPESATTRTVEASDLPSPVVPTSAKVIDRSCPGCTFVISASATTNPVEFTAYATPAATTDDSDSCPGCIIPSAI
ncbi:hypothetical protein ACEPAI_7369 [Sanghuangporus weigelae]